MQFNQIPCNWSHFNMEHVYREGVPQESENQGEGSNLSDLSGGGSHMSDLRWVVQFVRFKRGGGLKYVRFKGGGQICPI